MHETLAETWREAHRVLTDGGIACINIGDATRTVNGRFCLFPNHSRIIEHCEKTGFTNLPYILWKKPIIKPKYKGKGAFLGSGFLPPNAYVTLDCEFIQLFRKGKLRKFPPKTPPIRKRLHQETTRRMVHANLGHNRHAPNNKPARKTNRRLSRRNRQQAHQNVQRERRHRARPLLRLRHHR
jgi:DNA modification methylase